MSLAESICFVAGKGKAKNLSVENTQVGGTQSDKTVLTLFHENWPNFYSLWLKSCHNTADRQCVAAVRQWEERGRSRLT